MALARPGFRSSLLVTVTGLAALALIVPACAPGPETGPGGGAGAPGSGGAVGSGGASTSGGAPGSGGASTSGGAPGSGGASTSGGAPGSGGAVGSGGRSQSGGAPATGGAASGGAANSGGRVGTGGAGSGGRTGGSTGMGTGGSGTGGKGTGGAVTGTGGMTPAGDPPTKTVRVFWLRPSDVPDDTKHPDGIAKVMMEAQKYYKQELGKTFNLNNPVVQTVVGEHVKSWYENTANGGDKYWWSVTNMQQELLRRFNLKDPDSRWMIVGEVSAEGDGAGGGGSPGWVILCQHDADGAAGIGGTINRWYGGMVHELGHAFGLPDAASTDGTPMSASLYDYPNTHFSTNQKNSIMSGPYGSFLF